MTKTVFQRLFAKPLLIIIQTRREGNEFLLGRFVLNNFDGLANDLGFFCETINLGGSIE